MGTAKSEPFRQPVHLSVKGLPALVTSLEQFDAALKPKTRISSELFARFLALDDQKLTSLTAATRQAADLLQRALKQYGGNPHALDALFRKLGPAFFSQDHGWRALFTSISALPPARDDLKLLALSRYRSYLLARHDALHSVGANRLESQIRVNADSVNEEVTELKAQKPAVTQELSRSETIVRDVVQLPRGKTAGLRAEDQASVDIWMAKHRFRIEMWQSPSFIDSHGNSAKLNEGRNLIGRGLSNDIIIDPRYAEVSRSHMILDVEGGRPVGITDLSSGGTYLSRSLVNLPPVTAKAS